MNQIKPKTNDIKTIILQYPITLGEKVYEIAEFKRPTFAILRLLGEEAKKSEMEGFLSMVSNLTGWPKGVVEKIDMEDFPAFKEAYQDLVGKYLVVSH